MTITALALCFLCNIFILSSGLFNISRFGLKTHFYTNSGPDGSFNLTLYWNSEIQICQFINPVNKASHEYLCDEKSNIVILKQQQPHQYKFKIDYNHTSVFRVDTLFVEDIQGNRYSMDTFCGAQQFYYWNGGPVYDTATETLCDSPWNDKFNYNFIKLDTATTKLNTLYVTFAGNISDANNIIGIISPAYIKSFAVRISDYSLQPIGRTRSFLRIQTMLFWDIYSYSCIFNIDKNKTVYKCDGATQTKTNETRFAFEIVNNNHNNILFIDHIFIKDYSDLPYQYNISIFTTYTSFDYNLFATNPWNGICVGNTFNDANSNGNNMLQFPELCIDSCSCGYNKFIIDFPMELMLNVEKSQCGFVYPINDDISTCTPVVWTSTSSYSSTDLTNKTSTLVILATHEDVQPPIPMTLFLAMIVICVLVFVLILGGIYVKQLKKYIPNDNDYMSLPGSELTYCNEISHNSVVAPGIDSEEVVDNDAEGDGPILNRDITQSQTEGYNKITKMESCVDLQIIQGDDSKNDKITNDGDNDNGNIINKNNIEKDHVLLDGMLSDVLQMKSLDPNKVHEMNENNVKQIETDSDDSDNMYDEIEK
eukprot:526742_1